MRRLTHSWRAIGTTNSVTVTSPEAIVPAATIATEWIARLDRAASRFRRDSELSRLNEAARTGSVTAHVSPLLALCVDAALHAARLTGGLVDPTLGGALAAAGYDDDLTVVQSRPAGASPSGRTPARVDWHDITFEPADGTLSFPCGTQFDLGAIAKAAAADALAERLAAELPGGVLVNLGGDIAVGGTCPTDGWPIGVENHRGTLLQTVCGTGQAFATSCTAKRTWTMPGGGTAHHIIDPRTGVPARADWAQVTCAGVSAVQANAAATAAIVLGDGAPAWLAERGIPARLDGRDGRTVATPGWPLPIPAEVAA